MNKSIISILTLAVAACTITSCSDDVEGSTETVQLTPALSYYYNPQSGNQTKMPPVLTTLTIDSRGKVDAKITDFRYYPTAAPSTLELSNMVWQNGAFGVTIIDSRNPETPEGQTKVSRYEAYYADRRVNNRPVPISYSVIHLDDLAYIASFPSEEYAFGKTVTRTVNNPDEEYVNTDMFYHFTFNTQNLTATLTMEKAMFGFGMPFPMTLVADNLPVKFSAKGFTIEAASVIPTSAGVPYPRFEMTDLEIFIPFINKGSVKFNCAGKWAVNAEVSTIPEMVK